MLNLQVKKKKYKPPMLNPRINKSIVVESKIKKKIQVSGVEPASVKKIQRKRTKSKVVEPKDQKKPKSYVEPKDKEK